MKLLRILLISFVVSGLLFAQPAGSAAHKSAESEQAVLKLENEFLAAALRSDAAAIEPMLADDFYFIAADGAVQRKADFLAPIRSGDLKILATEMRDVVVHFSSGDMVVLTYRSTDRGMFKGTEFSGDFRWTDVVVKRNGRWQFLMAQGTAIPATK
jgi:hypothetical protein